MATAPSAGRTETLNEVQIYFERLGTGEALLLLHGFSGSGQDWIPSAAEWGPGFELILPDLRGHGRSTVLSKPFRHQDAAADIFALLDHLQIGSCKGVGISGGGNVLLHLATSQPQRIEAMVLVSATPYFPLQARSIMNQYGGSLTAEQRQFLVRRHSGGEAQVRALLAGVVGVVDRGLEQGKVVLDAVVGLQPCVDHRRQQDFLVAQFLYD